MRNWRGATTGGTGVLDGSYGGRVAFASEGEGFGGIGTLSGWTAAAGQGRTLDLLMDGTADVVGKV